MQRHPHPGDAKGRELRQATWTRPHPGRREGPRASASDLDPTPPGDAKGGWPRPASWTRPHPGLHPASTSVDLGEPTLAAELERASASSKTRPGTRAAGRLPATRAAPQDFGPGGTRSESNTLRDQAQGSNERLSGGNTWWQQRTRQRNKTLRSGWRVKATRHGMATCRDGEVSPTATARGYRSR
jgi:hypothetical protein